MQVLTEADAVVEGTRSGNKIEKYGHTAETFHVDRVLLVQPSVHPRGDIVIVHGPASDNEVFVPGRYLLFLEYVPKADTYTELESGEFRLVGQSVTLGCGKVTDLVGSPLPSQAPMPSVAQLEAMVGTLHLHKHRPSTEATSRPQSPRQALH